MLQQFLSNKTINFYELVKLTIVACIIGVCYSSLELGLATEVVGVLIQAFEK